jgi:hypothetical protein
VIAWIEVFTARKRDPVVVGKIANRLHVRIDGVQVERHGAERGHALDADIAPGLAPDGQERADAARPQVQATGEDRFIDARATAEPHPLSLEIEAASPPMLFQDLLVLHNGEGQISNTELLADTHDGLRFGHGDDENERARGAHHRYPTSDETSLTHAAPSWAVCTARDPARDID